MMTRLMRPGFPALLVALFATAEAAGQAPAARSPGDGTYEGVAVHGDWTITIVRDGEVVERRKFQNALTETGELVLSGLLSRVVVAGTWHVILHHSGSSGLCVNQVVQGECRITEVDGQLTVSREENQVVLQGFNAADNGADIVDVSTLLALCPPDFTADACATTTGTVPNDFTLANLDPAIPVQAGDQIEVTVVLSFN